MPTILAGIVVGENSHVRIIERHQSLTSNAILTNDRRKTKFFRESFFRKDYEKRTVGEGVVCE